MSFFNKEKPPVTPVMEFESQEQAEKLLPFDWFRNF